MAFKNYEEAKAYYAIHKEDFKRRALAWKLRDPDGFRAVRRRAEKKFNSTPRGIWHILKTNSKKNGRDLDISVEEFTKWYISQDKKCEYCCRPQEENRRLEIDRMDNKIGYTLSNMTLACEDCNGVKGKYLSYDEMKIVGEIVMKKRWKI